MEDRAIVALYWARDEQAIEESRKMYEKYCRYIASHILSSDGDVEECLNDIWLAAWNAMPPHQPERLGVFLGKLTRNAALDRLRFITAEKRGAGEYALAAEELAECLSGEDDEDRAVDAILFKEAMDRFLGSLPRLTRRLFLRRYWYMASISELARDFGLSESRVGVILFRTRKKLRDFLTKEGITI